MIKIYIGQTGRSVSIHKKDHQCCWHLGHVEQSELAHRAWSTRHKILLFEETALMCNISSYHNRLVRESLEFQLSEQVINKEDGAKLSNVWLPVLESLKASNTGQRHKQLSKPRAGE